jgi:hypothetical protein
MAAVPPVLVLDVDGVLNPYAATVCPPEYIEFVADRPAVWIDDLLTPQARRWADRRGGATLLIDVDPTHGLQRPMVDQALAWASRLTP